MFPVAAAGADHFSVDDRCAGLNGGSYLQISPDIRAQANAECEAFIARSLHHLLRAFRDFDVVTVYDNSRRGKAPARVLEVAAGRGVTHRAERLPRWLRSALKGSEFA